MIQSPMKPDRVEYLKSLYCESRTTHGIVINELLSEVERSSSFEAMKGSPTLADIERFYILRTLDKCDGSRARTAETLQIGKRTLYGKLKEYGAAESEPTEGES